MLLMYNPTTRDIEATGLGISGQHGLHSKTHLQDQINMMVHGSHARTQEVRQEDHRFVAILDYTVRPCIKQTNTNKQKHKRM
jgi:hypothetical protein